MKKAAVASSFVAVLAVALFLALGASAADSLSVPIFPLDQVRPGLHGVAYTVFQGVKPEPMDVEVLGVLHNVNGPKGDIILVRLHGPKPEYTGVVAGMSGSPVYIDGKLAGALAFRIGEFSKEPIAGVTPIQHMLEINAMDTTPPPPVSALAGDMPAAATARSASLGATPGLEHFANLLHPIEAPLVFSGFTEETVRRFASQFASAGIVPVMGAGSVSNASQPEPIEPGSAISAVLVRGDMDIAATCTVTYVDAQRLLACGHPLLQFGQVDIPMNKAQVLATLPSPYNAFKIVDTTEPVGAFVQDRHSGILGRFDRQPQMIPVTLKLDGPEPKQFHYEVLNNAKLTPVAMMATIFNVLQGINEGGSDVTYRLQGRIQVTGYPDVTLRNMYAPSDGNVPTPFNVAVSLGDRFTRIFDNPFQKADIKGVELSLDLIKERRSARLDSARTDVTDVRPGDTIVIEAVLRPYRGEPMVKQIPVRIPGSSPKGQLRILVSDGDTLDRFRRAGPAFNRSLDLGSTIALLNKERSNSRLYVSLLESNPEAMVQDKVMPALPPSVLNVMDGMRGSQDMIVMGESAVSEASTPLDYVVTGAQLITVNVR